MIPYRSLCAHNNRIHLFSLSDTQRHAWICQDCGKRHVELPPYPWRKVLLLWAIIFFVSCGVPALFWMGGGR